MGTSKLRRSVVVRLLVVALLSLILMIPVSMIKGLIKERETRQAEAVKEISSKWGAAQTVIGPVLTVPYIQRHSDKEGKSHYTSMAMHFRPDTLSVESNIGTEVRYRGIYEAALYNSKINLSGSFSKITPEAFGPSAEGISWGDAKLSIGVTDLKGIRSPAKIVWNSEETDADMGSSFSPANSGVSARVIVSPIGEKHEFSVDIDLNGSTALMFVPIGKETSVHVKSDWINPSFDGEFLPVSREIGPDGFDASWNVLQYNINMQWMGNGPDFSKSAFGLKLFFPVDIYQKTMRTAKYALLLIFIAFLSFFTVEVLSGKDMHPIQYLLIGAALVLFYSLLLSLSEHISFGIAYFVSCAVMVTMVSLYTWGAVSDGLVPVVIASLLSALYGFVYIIIQLQDYALLLGSIGLTVMLSLFMYITRNIDWFDVWKAKQGNGKP